MVRKLVVVSALAGLAMAAACEEDDNGERFGATLSGSAEVPPVTTQATGSATFTIDGDEVRYQVQAQNLNAATVAHIHSGAPGQSGPPVVFLFQSATPVNVNGALATGSFDATKMIASTGVSYDSLLSLMRRGNAYVNVHTTARPGGEIRGQIVRD